MKKFKFSDYYNEGDKEIEITIRSLNIKIDFDDIDEEQYEQIPKDLEKLLKIVKEHWDK